MSLGDPPLLGRHAVLDSIVEARRNGRAAVVIAGPLGSGRSHLLNSALEQLATPAHRELILVPEGAAGLTLFALRHLARPSSSATDFAELARSIENELRSRGPGLVIGVDDAHHLDPASAAVIRQVVTTAGCFALLTVRTGVPVPTDVRSLWKDGAAHRIDLEPLAEVEVESLLVALLDGPVEATTARHLAVLSDGNPLLLRELAIAGLASGALVQHMGTWRWRGPDPASARLQELLAERLDHLQPDERWATELVAIGGPIPADRLLSAVSPETIDSLESALLIRVEDGSVELRQPAHASIIASMLPSLRADAIRREAARLLESADGPWRQRLRVAVLRHAAGDDVDPLTLTTAARSAIWSSGHVMADALADGVRSSAARSLAGRTQAVPLGAEADIALSLAERAWRVERSFETGVELAQVLGWTNDGERAASMLEAIDTLASTPDERALVAMARNTLHFWTEGDAARADTALQIAECDPQRAQRDPALTRELRRIRAGNELNRGRPQLALELLDSLEQGSGDDVASVRARPTAAAALGMIGQVETALRLIDESLAIALEHRASNPGVVEQLMFAKFGALARGGRITEARDLAITCHQFAVSAGSVDGASAFGTLRGKALALEGRLGDSAQVLRESVLIGHDRSLRRWAPWTFSMLASALARRGEVSAATEALDSGRAARIGDRFYDIDIHLAAADVHEADGRVAEARSHALEAAHWAADAAMPVDEAIAWHAVARTGGTADARDGLDRLRGAADGGFIDLLADHVLGRADRDRQLLDDVLQRAIAMSLGLVAAEVANDRAALVGRTGRTRADSAVLRRADELADACQGARFGRLDGQPDAPALTRREIEVARLAGTGLTSRDIAERLHCSVRTVETHLYRVYFKLGVTDRAALASIPGIGPSR